MVIKRVIINYVEEVSKIITSMQQDLEKIAALDESYFLQLRDRYNLESIRECEEWNAEYNDNSSPPPPITDFQYFKKPFKLKWIALDKNLKKFQEFLKINLPISQVDPVKIDPLAHPWGTVWVGSWRNFGEFTENRLDVCEDDEFHLWYWEEGLYEIDPEKISFFTIDSRYHYEYDGELWLYQDAIYSIKGNYSSSEKKLLILEFSDKERRKFEKLQNKFSSKESKEIKYDRARISEEVRIAVWRRDQGKCARCGRRENLEYDHIVPVSKGGGNTARNIELLCQNCNRSKSNRIE